MTEDTRREATPAEAYRLTYHIGTEEELARLRAEVKPPSLLGKPKGGPGRHSSPSEPSQAKAFIAAIPLRYRVRAIGAAVALILLAIVGHAIGGGGIKAGDCVTTITNPLNDNSHIFEASCSSPPSFYYRVLQVRDSTGGFCAVGDTTFQDDPANKTYCLQSVASAP
jgi:hypothetical protein